MPAPTTPRVTAAAAIGTSSPESAAHPADRLAAAIEALDTPACVGLDPVPSKLPQVLGHLAPVEAIRRFCEGVVDAVAGKVPVVKLQSACFERHGAAGFEVLGEIATRARARGLVVILDAKRGDIGVSAEHYAEAARALGGEWVTVNGYFGPECLAPFRRHGGAFVLVRTSNPDGDLVQHLQLADGRSVAEAMADLVATGGASSVGACGFSDLGAVVGATRPHDAAALRARMPQQFFLVPGYGAQGGSIEDVRPCFTADGRGALVTASRSVIYAFDRAAEHWADQVAEAADSFAGELRTAFGTRS